VRYFGKRGGRGRLHDKSKKECVLVMTCKFASEMDDFESMVVAAAQTRGEEEENLLYWEEEQVRSHKSACKSEKWVQKRGAKIL
jgi:hypothetical protein